MRPHSRGARVCPRRLRPRSFPCFLAIDVPALERVGAPVSSHEIWLVQHPDLQRTARIRAVAELIVEVCERNGIKSARRARYFFACRSPTIFPSGSCNQAPPADPISAMKLTLPTSTSTSPSASSLRLRSR
jgi:hypothetical protein